jgi:catalase
VFSAVLEVDVRKWQETHIIACHFRYNTGDDDNFSQPTLFWKKTLKPEERERLVQNIVDHLKDAADFIQVGCCYHLITVAVTLYNTSAVFRT